MKFIKYLSFLLFILFLLSCETMSRIRDETISIFHLSFEKSVKPDPESEVYKKIDEYALHTPTDAEKNIHTLAAYLTANAISDREIARAIYIWITDNVVYDVDAFFSGKYGSQKGEDVIRTRKAVCEGYANLYLLLGREAGLETEKITGFAKGFAYKDGAPVEGTNHAWNAVKLEEGMCLIDSTWGAGGITLDGKFVKDPTTYWFDVKPEQMIYSHLPEDERWQLIAIPVTKAQFQSMPGISNKLFLLGFTEEEIFTELQRDNFMGFPTVYDVFDNRVKKVYLPISGVLQKGKPFDLKLVIPGALQAVIIVNKKIDKMGKIGNNFYCRYYPLEEGKLRISAEFKSSKGFLYSIIEYEIKEF